MPIDNSIYQLAGRGVKSVQDYDQEAQATEAAKLGNLLNRSKIDEYQAGVQEKNALRSYLSGGANLSTPEGVQGLYRVAPTQAGSILKDQAAMLKEGAQARSANATASASEWELKLKKANTAISDIASLGSPQDAVASIQKHLQLGDIDEQKAQAMLSSIPQDPAQFPEWRKSTLMRLLDAKTQLEMQKPQVQYENSGASKVAVNTNAYAPGGVGPVAGVAPIKMTADPNAVLSSDTARRGQNMVDARSREQIAQGGKAPPGYRYKPDGSMEAIPGGPADAKAQAAAQLKANGATDVDVAIGTLRDAYDRLEKGGGITSTKNGALGNASAWASSSSLGQGVGKAFGTDNQSARNDIAMARPALLAAMMKATGMSAKQMDSNAELKLWLSTATDPTLDIESNRRALANIERKYLGGASIQEATPSPSDKPSGGLSPAEQAELQQLRDRFGKKK